MSHHLDSPQSRRDPRLNLTDVYAFNGTTGTVFVLVTNTSLAGPDRPAGFHPEARYELKVHLDGAAREDLMKAPGISEATARAVYDHFHAG